MSAPMEYAKLTGPQKAAILVAVLDDDAASTICRHLPEEDLQRVAREISRLGRIPSHISQQVLREYRQMTAGRDYVSEGGRETTHRLLTRVLGEDGATSMLHKLLRVDELDANRAPALSRPPIPSNSPGCSKPSIHKLSLSSSVISSPVRRRPCLPTCLPRSGPNPCAAWLTSVSSPLLSPSGSNAVQRRLRSFGESNRRTYSGFQNVAALMNSVDAETSREILENIEGQDSKLAFSIRELMFTFEDFLRVPDVQLRELSATVDKKVLSIALKGTTMELRDHFFRTMSGRAVEMLKEDIDSLGPIKSTDVNKAQADMISLARSLEKQGKLTLRSDGGDAYV